MIPIMKETFDVFISIKFLESDVSRTSTENHQAFDAACVDARNRLLEVTKQLTIHNSCALPETETHLEILEVSSVLEDVSVLHIWLYICMSMESCCSQIHKFKLYSHLRKGSCLYKIGFNMKFRVLSTHSRMMIKQVFSQTSKCHIIFCVSVD